MPLKNILKKNEGIINVNIKTITSLTANSKITSPNSKIGTIDNQSVKGKNVNLYKF